MSLNFWLGEWKHFKVFIFIFILPHTDYKMEKAIFSKVFLEQNLGNNAEIRRCWHHNLLSVSREGRKSSPPRPHWFWYSLTLAFLSSQCPPSFLPPHLCLAPFLKTSPHPTLGHMNPCPPAGEKPSSGWTRTERQEEALARVNKRMRAPPGVEVRPRPKF